jgi:hypothetical protein
VWQVVKDGQVPYEDLDGDDISKVKNSDKELRLLLEEMSEDVPDYFRTVIVAMTKYAPKDRADLASVDEMMGRGKTNDTSPFLMQTKRINTK